MDLWSSKFALPAIQGGEIFSQFNMSRVHCEANERSMKVMTAIKRRRTTTLNLVFKQPVKI